MSDQRVSFSERVYAVLIRAYPRSFRDEYGEELQNFFRDQLREYRREKGSVRVSLLWLARNTRHRLHERRSAFATNG